MKRLIVSGSVLFVSAWMPAMGMMSPAPARAAADRSTAAMVVTLENPQRVEDLVPSPTAVAPEPSQVPDPGEPIAIPVPTALQAGMSVFGMVCVYRLTRRIRLAA